MRPGFSKDMRVIAWTQQLDKHRTMHIKKVHPTIDQIRGGTIELPVIMAMMSLDPGGRVWRENADVNLSLDWLLTLDGFDQMIYSLWRSYQ